MKNSFYTCDHCNEKIDYHDVITVWLGVMHGSPDLPFKESHVDSRFMKQHHFCQACMGIQYGVLVHMSALRKMSLKIIGMVSRLLTRFDEALK